MTTARDNTVYARLVKKVQYTDMSTEQLDRDVLEEENQAINMFRSVTCQYSCGGVL